MPLEVITGPMFSGKTEELIRRLNRAAQAKKTVILFKPEIDKRYTHENFVSTHTGQIFPAINISTEYNFENLSEFITNTFGSSVDVVGIDEVQFFSKDYFKIFKDLANSKKRLIATGLDTDYRFEPFGIVPELLSIADKVKKLTAVCAVCSKKATRTQRLEDGLPAYTLGPIIQVGGSESYEARCRKCHRFGK